MLLVNLGQSLSSMLNEIQLKTYSSVENRKTVTKKMQLVKILLRQSQISKKKKKKKTISKYKKCTLVLYLVAHTENNLIPAHYEEIIKYFIVINDFIVSIGNVFIQTDLQMYCYDMLIFKNKSIKPNMLKMVSRGVK